MHFFIRLRFSSESSPQHFVSSIIIQVGTLVLAEGLHRACRPEGPAGSLLANEINFKVVFCRVRLFVKPGYIPGYYPYPTSSVTSVQHHTEPGGGW